MPYEFHRYIIGANGQEVRKMAEKYSIVIEVPHPSSQEDVITLLGPAHHCEEGKQALELKVQELEAKKEERVRITKEKSRASNLIPGKMFMTLLVACSLVCFFKCFRPLLASDTL